MYSKEIPIRVRNSHVQILGDTAVAVNPDTFRPKSSVVFQSLHGSHAVNLLMELLPRSQIPQDNEGSRIPV